MNVMDGQSIVLGQAGLTGIAGAATTFSTDAFDFAINGKAGVNAAVAGGATPTTGAVSGAGITLTAGKARAVLWVIDAAGTEKVVEGEVVDLDADGNYITDVPQLPQAPADHVPFGYTVHKAGPTVVGTWTFGSSNWNATGMTHVVGDLAGGLPDRPDAS